MWITRDIFHHKNHMIDLNLYIIPRNPLEQFERGCQFFAPMNRQFGQKFRIFLILPVNNAPLPVQIIGIGCEAQSVLSEGKLGGFLSINIGAALGVTFGIYWSLGVSGK